MKNHRDKKGIPNTKAKLNLVWKQQRAEFTMQKWTGNDKGEFLQFYQKEIKMLKGKILGV